MQPIGVRYKPEERRAKALKAAQIADTLKDKPRNQQIEAVMADIDCSYPTARNLIDFGRRLLRNENAG